MTKDAQHGDITVVDLVGTFGEHSLPVKVVPAKVGVAVVGVVHKRVANYFDILPEVEIKG